MKFKLRTVTVQPATGGFIITANYRKDTPKGYRRYKDATIVAATPEAALNIAKRLIDGDISGGVLDRLAE